MIKEEYRKKCNKMLGEETADSYLCLIGTTDGMTGLDFYGSIIDLSTILYNAALNNPSIRRALKIAYSLLKESYSEETTEKSRRHYITTNRLNVKL